MGQSKLFGSGSGKPVNAVKVTETAIEDIPANCFVSKKQGYNLYTLESLTSETPCCILLDNGVIVYAINTLIYTVLNNITVQSGSFTGADFDTDIVVMKHRNWIFSKSAGKLIRVADDGTFAATDFNFPSDMGYIAKGEYSTDVIYSYVSVNGSSMETSGYNLVKWQVNGYSSFDKISETFLTNSYGQDYNKNPRYFHQADVIISCGTQGSSAYNISMVKASTAEILIPHYGGIYSNGGTYAIYLTCQKVVTDDVLTYNNALYIFKSNYYANGVYNLGLTIITPSTGTVSSTYVLEGPTGSSSTDVYAAAACKFIENYWYIAYLSDTYKKIYVVPFNPSTKKASTTAVLFYNFGVNTYEISYLFRINNPRFELYNIGYSNANHTLTYSPGHIEISDGTIYGLSQNPIKAHEQGNVYCVDTSYPSAVYTAYGITEALATQIIDDSVDEIKQEVQNG